jgi:transposase-like protein
VYPVVLIDAIYVKIRDGQVTNRPIYVAVGVTCAGERDILGLWPATAGRDMERAQVRFRRLVLLPDVSRLLACRRS